MSDNYTSTIDALGLSCPKGGKFYICEDAWAKFIGCCTRNPCADGIGICSEDDLRPSAFSPDSYQGIFQQDCQDVVGTRYWYTCSGTDPPFLGCCAINPCIEGCPQKHLVAAMLSGVERNRLEFLNPRIRRPYTSTDATTLVQPTSMAHIYSFALPDYDRDSNIDPGLIRPGAVAGICVAAMIIALLSLGALLKYWRANAGHRTDYSLIEKQDSTESTESDMTSPPQASEKTKSSDSLWHRSPGKLNPSNFTWFIGWAWDIVLTLVPICFIALAHIALYLDGQPKSTYGQRILELTRVSPSLYPILFAAVASRFYKNFARWCLERPDGIGLAVLEQIFGSQSFASAFERVFSIRTHIVIGVTILLTWAMSPLGGQSASRILFFGNGTTTSNGTINYLHPSYQVSSYKSWKSSQDTKSSVAALYSSSLLSSLEQKRSARDLWDLPKIPQWKRGRKVGETYPVDQVALEKGFDYYASLLGIKIQGLSLSSGDTQYNFSVQTSYTDFQCAFASNNTILEVNKENAVATFFANVTSPLSWKEWLSLDSPPPLQMLYLSKSNITEGIDGSVWSTINCTMQTVWLETDIQCGPRPSARSCFAQRQRRLRDDISANRLPNLMIKNPIAMQQAISLWPKVSGDMRGDKASPTENYIMEEAHPYAGQDLREWNERDRSIFPDVFSRRFTTAFNTFWDATLNPLGHTNITFDTIQYKKTPSQDEFNIQPFMNTTVGTVTVNREVYRASRLWIAILLTTTIFLEILAVLGLVLEAFILGPEVLGFASSMTRDNIYVPLPPSGSSLDGPDRARMLQHLRLQLADVRPRDEVGHLAVRAVPREGKQKSSHGGLTEQACESVSWRPLDRKRLYD